MLRARFAQCRLLLHKKHIQLRRRSIGQGRRLVKVRFFLEPVCTGAEEAADAYGFYRPTTPLVARSIESDRPTILISHWSLHGSDAFDDRDLAFGPWLSIFQRPGRNFAWIDRSDPRASGSGVAKTGRRRQFPQRFPSPSYPARWRSLRSDPLATLRASFPNPYNRLLGCPYIRFFRVLRH